MGVSSWIPVVVVLVAGAALGGPRGKPHYDPARAGEYFEQFVADHGRQYGSEQEKQRRLEIFTQNLATINERNQRDMAVYGITKFADLQPDEFRKKIKGYKSYTGKCEPFDMSTIQNITSNDAWDWRTKNAVVPVKDQGECFSSWAFSTMGNLEGQLAIKYKTLIPLSEQELLECDSAENGCTGSLDMDNIMLDLKRIGGVMSEADYPYDYDNIQACRFNSSKSKVKVANCTVFSEGLSEKYLKVILKQTGPLAVAVCSSGLEHYYRGIAGCYSNILDYAALLVGYGKEEVTPYWIIKPSWGRGWGEDGYYRLKMGIGGCGLLHGPVVSAVIE